MKEALRNLATSATLDVVTFHLAGRPVLQHSGALPYLSLRVSLALHERQPPRENGPLGA
jgi:hypothetical protein